MKLSKGSANLGLPEYIKFGLELEVENLNGKKVGKLIKNNGWKSEDDMSLNDNGSECVSPVLQEREDKSVWEEVAQVCDAIKQCPAIEGKEPYTDNNCGGHIHFDADILRQNPEIMKNFLKLWTESEELVYKMCNAEGEPIRPGAMEAKTPGVIIRNPIKVPHNIREIIDSYKFFNKTIGTMFSSTRVAANVAIGNLLFTRNGMAGPRGREIQKQLESGNLKVAKPKNAIYRNLIVKQKFNKDRYYGLNLSNMGNKKKNTIEFRLSNGTIDPDTIKENTFLYASLIKTAVDMTRNPELMSDKVDRFFDKDLDEEGKLDAFLALTMDDEQDRDVYKRRWESVKDNPIYKKNKNFAKGVFKRDDYKEVAEQEKSSAIKDAFNYIANLKEKMLGKDSKEEENVIGD